VEVLQMSEAKFTPGPWECKQVWTPSGRAFRIGKDAMLEPGPRGCCIIYDDYGYGTNERSANAALIAAAPWLYSALESLLKTVVDDLGECGYGEDDIADHEGVKNAKAALAKARGE
jgi:hypothetical protein